MKIVQFLKSFLMIFCITFIVSALVSFLYSFIIHENGVADWDHAFRFGIIFGLVFPILNLLKKDKS